MSYQLIWWVFVLPIFGFLWQSLGGKVVIDNLGTKVGRPLMGAFAVAPIFIGFLIAAQLTLKLAAEPAEARTHILTLFDWISVNGLSIPFEFRVDTLSMTMVLIITGIGSLIHLYATGYMAEEKDYTRFFTYLNLFIAAMLVLVLGNNLVLLFIGWEGVGVCSYLLIGFWYKDTLNSRAANKAFIVNRIGDYGLTLGMFLIVFMMSQYSSASQDNGGARLLSYDLIFAHAKDVFAVNPQLTTAAALLLFVGAMGKSAQFPLYIWLPDAMAGPTPVSALIHAATMVTSGVFLLNRMSPIVSMSEQAMGVIALIGAATSLLGALIAFGQTDIKKVLAFSTVSQLGYMFIACGSGAFWAGMFHVTTHAFFKALLFLGAGAVIHAMSHDQDMRHYGQLRKYIPITFATMMIGWLAISGVPFFAGFYSKEAALGAAVNSPIKLFGLPAAQIAGWVGFVVAFLTAAYMTRMTLLTFFSGKERWREIEADHGHDHHHHDHAHHHAHAHHGPDVDGFEMTDIEAAKFDQANAEPEHHHLDSHHTPHEVPWNMWVPLAVLAAASLLGGFLLENGTNLGNLFSFITGSHEPAVLEHWLYPVTHAAEEHGPVPHIAILGASLVAAFGGILFGWMKYAKRLPEDEGFDLSKWAPPRRAASQQFGVDNALAEGSIELGGIVGHASAAFDKGFVDGIVNGVGSLASGLGGIIGRMQRGYVRGYALVMQLGAMAIVGYFLYLVIRMGDK